MLKSLCFAKFTFTILARDTISLPPYKGSTFRGGFGNTFKRVVCIGRNKDCSTCLLRSRCIYVYVFETPPPEESVVMRKYETVPHPFIIEPSEDSKTVFEPGEMLSFGLVLIGKAIDSLPYFIYTFEELGNTGIGKGRGRYILDEVFTGNDSSESIYSAKDKKFKGHIQPLTITGDEGADGHRVSLSFHTPTRIVYDGHLTDEPEFHILIRNLLRRIAHLAYFHCGGDTSEFDFRGFINRAMRVSVKEKNIEWHDWDRYSARQDTRMKLGGFVGDITFEGELSEFIPYIKAGEIVHVGKGTSFGLGRYKIL